MVWIKFSVCALLVVLIGTKLSFYGDVIAERTGLGRLWVGAVIIGGITSLPELATALSAVLLLGKPNLAAGSLFGSCLFNVAILTFADLVYRKGSLLSSVEGGQILSAGMSILMVGLATFGVLLSKWISQPSILGFQLTGILLVVIYFLGVRLMLLHQLGHSRGGRLPSYSQISGRRVHLFFFILALGIVLLSIWLAYLGEEIVSITGWRESFVGVLFLAVVTSLPEIVVSYGAVKIGALDLSIGNVFGSNSFNIFILSICDFAFKGDFWGNLSPLHALAGISTILMSTVAVIGIFYKKEHAKMVVGWDSLLIILIYLITAWVMFTLRGVKG